MRYLVRAFQELRFNLRSQTCLFKQLVVSYNLNPQSLFERNSCPTVQYKESNILNTNPSSSTGRSRWLILFVVYLCQLAMAMAFQSIPPVIPLIIEDLKISHAQAGLLMGFFFFPGIVLSVFVGLIADKHKARNILIPSLLLIIGGALMVAFSPTYLMVGVGRLITGIGALSTSIVIPLILARWFLGKELGLAMAVFHTGVPMGSVISFNTMPALANAFGWRSSQLFTASMAVVALVVFLLLFVETPVKHAKQGSTGKKTITGIFKIGGPVWFLGLIWMLYTSSISSFLNFATDFLTKNGFSITLAGFTSGLMALMSFVFTPAAGLLIDRFRPQKFFIAVSGVVIAVLFVLIFNFPHLAIPLIAVMGLFAALVPPSVTTSVPLYMAPEKIGLAFGLTNALSNAGGVLMPYAAGFFRDFTGSYELSFWFFSFLSVLMTLLVMLLVFKTRTAQRVR